MGDCIELMKDLPDGSIDMVLTSPPYDNMQRYDDKSMFRFDDTAQELYRVIKSGGVLVWIVADQTKNGDETGTSFEQALFFKKIGFKLNDTMIWDKLGINTPGNPRYRYLPCFEYMFVFSKGKLDTFNPIKDRKNKTAGRINKAGTSTVRRPDGKMKCLRNDRTTKEYGARFNVWHMPGEVSSKRRTGHPAQMNEKIAIDHIKSWSNENDVILDPFVGSGTTLRACRLTGRNGIGFEINPNYKAMIDRATTCDE